MLDIIYEFNEKFALSNEILLIFILYKLGITLGCKQFIKKNRKPFLITFDLDSRLKIS